MIYKYKIRTRSNNKTAKNPLAVFCFFRSKPERIQKIFGGVWRIQMKMSNRFVNNRRVKRRYRGGIQTSLHNCYAKAPQKLRGFFYQLEHGKTHRISEISLGSFTSSPTGGLPPNQFMLAPELAQPGLNIRGQPCGERRINEINIALSEKSTSKTLRRR